MNDPLRYLKSALVALSLALPLQAQAPRASADSTFLSRNGATEARLGTLKVRSSVDPPSFSAIDLGNVATNEMQQRQHNRGRNALIGAVVGGSTVGGIIYYDCSRKTDCNVFPVAAVLAIGAGMALGALVGLLLTPVQ